MPVRLVGCRKVRVFLQHLHPLKEGLIARNKNTQHLRGSISYVSRNVNISMGAVLKTFGGLLMDQRTFLFHWAGGIVEKKNSGRRTFLVTSTSGHFMEATCSWN